MTKIVQFCCSSLLFILFTSLVLGVDLVRRKRNVVCAELPEDVLGKILGPAFNARYMSITEPVDEGLKDEESSKRHITPVLPFSVDQDYFHEFGDQPAWNVDSYRQIMNAHSRRRRNVKQQRQWECESKVVWTDLGVDYFPRYLRNIECTSKRCWYGLYKCIPRSFTVKVLKRRRGKCIESFPGTKVGNFGLHTDLRELWVWEERAVNFCCVCAMAS